MTHYEITEMTYEGLKDKYPSLSMQMTSDICSMFCDIVNDQIAKGDKVNLKWIGNLEEADRVWDAIRDEWDKSSFIMPEFINADKLPRAINKT